MHPHPGHCNHQHSPHDPPLTMLSAILPLEVKRRHLSQTVAGIIMGSFCFAWFFIPTFTIEKLFPFSEGRAPLGSEHSCWLFIVFCYGVEYFIPDDQHFLFPFLSVLTRFIEGCGCGIARTAMASLIAKIFPDELGIGQQARVMGTLLGLSLGVVTGSMLKEVLGYFGVFLTFSLLLLLSTALLLLFQENLDLDQNNHQQLRTC